MLRTQKKEPAALLPKIADNTATPTGSKVSIAKLLEVVNDLYPDILPENVLRHFGYDGRPDGKIGESVLYSSRTQGTTEENQQMEAHFGTTNNYDVAGYILTDGKMLDFSGKHWGDSTSDYRQVDHRDIGEVWESDERNGLEEMVHLIANGGIRLSPESGGINLATMPTSQQISTLRGYINHFGGDVVVDVDTTDGKTVETFTYGRGVSSSKVISDIRGYFENGTIPESRPSYRDFRYSSRNLEAQNQQTVEASRQTIAAEEHAQRIAEIQEANKQALLAYQAQRAFEMDAARLQYEAAMAKIRQAHEQEMKELKAIYGESAVYQQEFIDHIEFVESNGKKSISDLRKEFLRYAKEKSGDNKSAYEARLHEYQWMIDQYQSNWDYAKVEQQLKERREAAKAKVESARATEMRNRIGDVTKIRITTRRFRS